MSAMTLEEAQELLGGRDLIAIGARADDERRRRHGARTTFVRVLEVHVDAIPEALPLAAEPGEIRVIGRPQSADAAVTAVRRVLSLGNRMPVTAFSLADLAEVAGSARALPAMLRLLCDAGLQSLAELPIDRFPDPVAAVAAAHAAGLRVPRVTVQGTPTEAPGTPVDLVERARQLQAAVGGIRAFAPLPRTWSVAHPSTGYDDVKTIAAARLLADSIDSIQVDWALYGPKLAQVALTMGADDVDAVSALPGDLGRRRSPIEEIRRNIAAAGLEPIERDGYYRVLERQTGS